MMRRLPFRFAAMTLLLVLAAGVASAEATIKEFVAEAFFKDSVRGRLFFTVLVQAQCIDDTTLEVQLFIIQPSLEPAKFGGAQEIHVPKCIVHPQSVRRAVAIEFQGQVLSFGERPAPQAGSISAVPAARIAEASPSPYYFLNRTYEDLTVASFPDFQTLKTIAFRRSPFGMTFSPDQKFLYVTLAEESDPGRTPALPGVAVIDTRTNEQVDTIPISGVASMDQPAVSPDGKTLYVGARLPPMGLQGELIEVDLATKAVTSRIPSPPDSWLRGVAVSPDGALVVAVTSRSLAIYDTASRTLAASVPARPWDLNIAPVVSLTGSEVYIYTQRSNADQTTSGFVTVVDTKTATVARQIPLPAGFLASSLALSPNGFHLAVQDRTQGKVVMLDLYTGQAGPVIESPTIGLGAITFTVGRVN